MSRQEAIDAALAWFDAGGYFEDLGRRVAIPTESQEPERLPELYRYLDEEMRGCFEAMGFTCRVLDNAIAGQGPVLLAERMEDPALPTVLGYGHGDVVRGQAERWRDGLSPWTLTHEGDRVYGRGTADNKGQHTVHTGALAAVLAERGRLGFNARFMIETGEENGSKGLEETVLAHRDDFAADVFIASDGPRVDRDRANLTLGNRGAFNFTLECNLREGGHHSGNWGGVLANPGVVLAHALATIVDASGRVLVPDLLPEPIPNSVRESLAGVVPEGGEEAPEMDPGWGEPGLSLAEKIFAWNTFEVLAFGAGDPENPVNAVPPRAVAHCQIRFVTGSNPDGFVPALRRHLHDHGFETVTVGEAPASNAGGFKASRTDPGHPWARWAAGAVERTTGERAVVVPNSGGSICNYIFADHLGLPTIWLPLSYAGCSQHAPDEHLLAGLAREAMAIVAGLYWDLGEPGTPARETRP